LPSSALGPWDSETPTHGMSDKQSFAEGYQLIKEVKQA
jgi:hypothetical protein